MQLKPNELTAVCQMVHRLCGVTLDASKQYLIESRLGPLLAEDKLPDYTSLVSKVSGPGGMLLKQKVIDAITTQETLFFRDNSPFEALKFKALPELLDAKVGTPFPKRLRIWSAACSTGQEPYSIGIVLHEMLPDIHSWDIQIIASDISNEAIAKASRGLYTELELGRGMPTNLRSKYFTAKDGGWQVNDSLRALVSFRQLNLLDPLPPIGPVDILFCRNVAIYFERSQRDDLFRRFKAQMSREAYLFVGSSESLISVGPEFRPQAHCRSTFYRPNLDGSTQSILKSPVLGGAR